VVETETWHGGLAMGFLWSRMVCFAGESAGEIGASSLFAEVVGSFSTLSQEKRHERLPSWYWIPIPRTLLFAPEKLTLFLIYLYIVRWGMFVRVKGVS
jgi:hypothetical protein